MRFIEHVTKSDAHMWKVGRSRLVWLPGSRPGLAVRVHGYWLRVVWGFQKEAR